MCFLPVLAIQAQTKYYTKQALISFYSKAPIENIEAYNNKGVCVFETATALVECSVLLKGFEFEKALMQEHFNENYVESDQYPKAVFKGKINNISELKLDKNGSYTVIVAGTLTLHGETKPQQATIAFTIKNGNIGAEGQFAILLEDYKIKIPSVVADKISKTVTIKIKVPSFQILK